MPRTTRPAQIVLVGVGHTHAEIVRRWQRAPIGDAELTCVADAPWSAYSGMLPGVLSGQYRADAMTIDLRRLCHRSGVRLVVGEVNAFDARCGHLVVGDTRVPFDVASVGIGSVPTTAGVVIDDGAPFVPVKPMRSFSERLEAEVARAAVRGGVRVAVVGGGAGGVEIALALPSYLRSRLAVASVAEVALAAGPEGLTPGRLPATTRRVRAALETKGISVIRGRVTRVSHRQLHLADTRSLEVDVVVWATGASAPPLLRALGLPTDGRGFLLTADTLRTTGDGAVFAVGDSGSIVGAPAPKAGVHAVRQGPILWENLRRSLNGAPLRRYRPQSDFLRLLNAGGGRAIGEWRRLSFEGAWVWHLKDRIDRRFMARYQTG
jgi:pyridine nucleotide-disulfide oxidoreductase family protein